MKKILYASTILGAMAAPAMADIAISGEAKMGIVGGDIYDNDDAQFFNDFTLTVEATGETDTGLSFGLIVEMIKEDGPQTVNGPISVDSEEVFISGAFGTLSLGAVDGALYTQVGEAAVGPGTIADDETLHAGYNDNAGLDESEDAQILRYDYDFGDFGISASLEQDDNGAGSDDIYAVGVSYQTSLSSGTDLRFGLGYQSNSNDEVIGASVSTDFGNGLTGAVTFTTADMDAGGDDYDHVGIGIGYQVDAVAFGINYGKFDYDGADDADGVGLDVAYDLGGGAVAQFGYGTGDDGTGRSDSYSLGMTLSF